MLNCIWAFMLIVGIIYGAWSGNMSAVSDAVLDSSVQAVELVISMAGIVAMWCGIMEIADNAGIVKLLTRWLRPVVLWLFPGLRGEEGEKAAEYIKSDLFRPPHGHMRFPQVVWLRRHYRIIMWDVVTRDYSPHMTPNGVFNVVKNYTRNGSVIVFHDSLKAERNMREAMPRAIEWLQEQGYEFKVF